MTPAQVLRNLSQLLTEYEQGEILDFKQVFYVGQSKGAKVKGSTRAPNNHGYDDERGDYTVVEGDHLLFRYEMQEVLGAGSFGRVIKCVDHKTGEVVAVKIIRNKRRFHKQARIEVELLMRLRDADPADESCIIHLQDSFYFRHHLCIVFPILSLNLFEYLKQNSFKGLSAPLLRRIAVQVLRCLDFLQRQRIVHCDLKPENILLQRPGRSAVRVIDFGSSCEEDKRMYTYIQSRFYRAPEVILGLPYGLPIDMWSFGCILAELCTGYPIFPGEDEVRQGSPKQCAPPALRQPLPNSRASRWFRRRSNCCASWSCSASPPRRSWRRRRDARSSSRTRARRSSAPTPAARSASPATRCVRENV